MSGIFIGDASEGKSYYVPELRIRPALYAKKDPESDMAWVTMDAWRALRFDSKEECEKWCEKNHDKLFSAVEHVYYEHMVEE